MSSPSDNRTPDVTLQINLSGGDVGYCEWTVPALVATHRPDVQEIVVVVDCCRAQSTPVFHPDTRSSRAQFDERLGRLAAICERWRARGLVDRCELVESDGARLASLNQKYCGEATRRTHDHRGHAFSAYFAGWDTARTRYVAHFDADVLLHQGNGYSWVRAAVAALEQTPRALAASPRIAPPFDDASHMVRVDGHNSGWLPAWRLDGAPHGWESEWFSTRCHLIDRRRLGAVLPLESQRGRLSDAFSRHVDALLSPLFDTAAWTGLVASPEASSRLSRAARRLAHRTIPPFPLPPEVLLYEHAVARGWTCLYLDDPRAWFIHPDDKSDPFERLVPSLIEAVRRGDVPEEQRGVSGVQLDAWHALEVAQ
jgi:hypothetical protein